MAILALDLGTTTGFSLKQGAGSHLHGFWNLKPGKFDGAGMRYLKFRQKLQDLHEMTPLKAVYFEAVRRHNGTDAAHVYGGLMATLLAFCEEHHIPYEGVPVQTIKKFITGKGNAGKAEVIAAVRKQGFDFVVDDNEADAVALMLLKLEDPVAQGLLVA